MPADTTTASPQQPAIRRQRARDPPPGAPRAAALGMTSPASGLTGAQRAAVVLAQLDDDRVQAVLASMSEAEVVQLTAEVAQLPALAPAEVDRIVTDFSSETLAAFEVRQGGVDIARRWLHDLFGPNRAAEVLSEIETTTTGRALDFLNRVEPSQIARFLGDEHPQTAAVVLSNLSREHAARVLDRFEKDVATDIVRRMATLHTVPTGVTQRIADELGGQLANVLGTGAGDVDTVKVTASVLGSLDQTVEKSILGRVEETDPELAAAIRAEMFVFDDVAALDDVALQTVLRQVPLRDVALALKTAGPEVTDKFLRNLSAGAAQDLEEELQSLGPQRLSAIEAAQTEVVRTVQALADAETISLGRPDDELIA